MGQDQDHVSHNVPSDLGPIQSGCLVQPIGLKTRIYMLKRLKYEILGCAQKNSFVTHYESTIINKYIMNNCLFFFTVFFFFCLTLSQQDLVFTCLQYKSFENTRNEQFILFPRVFSTHLNNFLQFLSNLKLSSANSFSLKESKICRLGKG